MRRRNLKATPANPLPRRARLEGSGVATGADIVPKVFVPALTISEPVSNLPKLPGLPEEPMVMKSLRSLVLEASML